MAFFFFNYIYYIVIYRKMRISENTILSIIEKTLNENRKVIKVGNSVPAPAPAASMPPMAPNPDEYQDAMGGQPPVMNDPTMGDDGGDMGNQFDSNFDAGVEADEETDPKRYIQQLTGKLSQSLNSFNSEQGPDAGLSKYVASMIIAAACKNLDEKAKKELIEKINTANSDEEDVPEDDMQGADEEIPMDDNADMGGDEQQMQAPMNERVLTKREIREMMDACSGGKRPKETNKKAVSNDIPKAWKGKRQINSSAR